MGFSVYFSDRTITTDAGFGRVARIPCIIDNRPGYHRLGSTYLIARGLGFWSPPERGPYSKKSLPTDETLRNYAYWLANFLEWADCRKIDLSACTYGEHVQGLYQTEMVEGSWSRDGEGLSARTVNVRVQQACDFLNWMGDSGYRNEFEVPYQLVKVSLPPSKKSRRKSVEVKVRVGKVRQDKRRLKMPTDEQVTSWLDDVYDKFGHTMGLMCETILYTGIRREELCCLRTATLDPDPLKWHVNRQDAPAEEQQVLIEIKYGAKGTNYGTDHGDKIGPSRTIWIPRHLADRIKEYCMKHRHVALRRLLGSANSASEQRKLLSNSVHLFLEENAGLKISGKKIYQSWTGASLPFKGWSPHLGRDWWACSILLREMKKHEYIRTLDSSVAAALLESTAMGIIRLQIQPQLGHTQESTTLIYLSWLVDMLGISIPRLETRVR